MKTAFSLIALALAQGALLANAAPANLEERKVISPYVTVGDNGVQAPYATVNWRREDQPTPVARNVVAPYVTVDPNGEVQAPYVTVDWKRDGKDAADDAQVKRQWYEGPYVTVGPGGVQAPGATVGFDKRQFWYAGPYVTVGPEGVQAPAATVNAGGVQAPGANIQFARAEATAPTPTPTTQPPAAKRQYYEGPFVTVGEHGVEAPGVDVSY